MYLNTYIYTYKYWIISTIRKCVLKFKKFKFLLLHSISSPLRELIALWGD